MQTKYGNSVSLDNQSVKSCAHLSVLEEYIRETKQLLWLLTEEKELQRIGA